MSAAPSGLSRILSWAVGLVSLALLVSGVVMHGWTFETHQRFWHDIVDRVNCEIDGDTAHAESYCLYALRRRNHKTVILGGGRYIDKLTKENGEWRIKLRELYIDWRGEADATIFDTPSGYPVGSWDRTDVSYRRPLSRRAGA